MLEIVRSVLKRVATVVCVLAFAQSAVGAVCRLAGDARSTHAVLPGRRVPASSSRARRVPDRRSHRPRPTTAAHNRASPNRVRPEQSSPSTITLAVLQSLPPVVAESRARAAPQRAVGDTLAAHARPETPPALRPARLATHRRRVSTQVAVPGRCRRARARHDECCGS